MTKIVMLQTDIHFANPEKNYENVDNLFRKAMKENPETDLIILPEDWNSGFSDKMFHEIDKHAEEVNGPSITFLRNLAKEFKVWVVAGSLSIKHDDGLFRNTTYLINSDGEIVGDYSKMHLYNDMDENVAFENGSKTEVYDTEFGKLGFMICYDIRFPELARTYALKGADALIVVSDFPEPRLDHWKTLLKARAIENQMYVVACNRVGDSPMGTYFGHSLIIDPWGEIISEGTKEQEIITGEADFKETEHVRNLIHVFDHRQPQFYGEVVK